jgi:NurA-like 5'-3' nuclease
MRITVTGRDREARDRYAEEMAENHRRGEAMTRLPAEYEAWKGCVGWC